MKERETIIAKLAQNDTDQRKLREEHGRLQDKLAELDKPKLRHGDYGDAGHNRWIKIHSNIWWLRGFQKTPSSCEESSFIKSRKGNIEDIFDDLERNSKDLREFAVDWWGGYRFSAKLLDDSCGHKHRGAKIEIVSGGSCYAFEKIVEIHQKLGQLIATAKRENK